jgi:hypothetical protein
MGPEKMKPGFYLHEFKTTISMMLDPQPQGDTDRIKSRNHTCIKAANQCPMHPEEPQKKKQMEHVPQD